MSSLVRAAVVVVAVTLAGTLLPTLAADAPPLASTAAATSAAPVPDVARQRPTPNARAAAYPLRGLTIALDPGHQLGSHRFPRQINRLVPAGGFTKPCNTTGTATNRGIPEATVNFELSNAVKRRLTALGAVVKMTRNVNSERYWGPCVDKRGEFGARVHARLEVSLHADGAGSSEHGFHVIVPTRRSPWTTDIYGRSVRLGTALRDALTARRIPRSNYIGHGTGLDVRSDLATLNMSDVPVVMIEIGNMRNARDAFRMTHRKGRARYANAVVAGIRAYLGR